MKFSRMWERNSIRIYPNETLIRRNIANKNEIPCGDTCYRVSTSYRVSTCYRVSACYRVSTCTTTYFGSQGAIFKV
jgi:hypothetical protein